MQVRLAQEEVVLVEDGLAAAVNRWELSRHPFWEDWQHDMVDRSRLALLARELSRLLSLLPSAWDTVNDYDTAEAAGELATLWHPFAAGLADAAAAEQLPEADELLRVTRSLFLKEHTSLGALSAIHVELPLIARQLQAVLDRTATADGARLKAFTEYLNSHSELSGLPQRYLSQYGRAQQASAAEAAAAEAEALWQLFNGVRTAA